MRVTDMLASTNSPFLCTFMLTQLYATSEHDPPEKVKDTVPVQQASELDSSRNSGGAERYGARDIKT